MDYANARIVEVDGAGAEEEADAKGRNLIDKAASAIKDTLKQHRAGMSGMQLREICGGKKAVHLVARKTLLDDHTIFAETEGRWPVYKLSVFPD
jgi:hypothetical protein